MLTLSSNWRIVYKHSSVGLYKTPCRNCKQHRFTTDSGLVGAVSVSCSALSKDIFIWYRTERFGCRDAHFFCLTPLGRLTHLGRCQLTAEERWVVVTSFLVVSVVLVQGPSWAWLMAWPGPSTRVKRCCQVRKNTHSAFGFYPQVPSNSILIFTFQSAFQAPEAACLWKKVQIHDMEVWSVFTVFDVTNL